ncbi:hypothetical protein [Ruminococcus sp.]|uniref:hypothetical protein n=1 Tax=Ruminococcus sp. TaxID=41978 RepID=UPI001B756310|nr:hypothetical protein [Ruminococcus sp.]MBP5434166.1 hypothetical protein [Ruminococcus sp.]
MNIDITNGKKQHFDNIEDVFQTFFSIAIAAYNVASNSDDGVLTMLGTTDDRGRMRIRIDFLKEGETMSDSWNDLFNRQFKMAESAGNMHLDIKTSLKSLKNT